MASSGSEDGRERLIFVRQRVLDALKDIRRLYRIPIRRLRHPVAACSKRNMEVQRLWRGRAKRLEKLEIRNKKRKNEPIHRTSALPAPSQTVTPISVVSSSMPSPPLQRFIDRNRRLLQLQEVRPRARPPPRDRSAATENDRRPANSSNFLRVVLPESSSCDEDT